MKIFPARLNDKPHYIFHPMRLLRRTIHYAAPRASTEGRVAVAHLPWGLQLEVYSSEAIGYSILTAGVFDPCVTETLHRLIDPGDVVIDVGANVGYFTSLAAVRAGANGTVIAYEPHPQVFNLLESNIARWIRLNQCVTVEAHELALSDRAGTAELDVGPIFHHNMGLASLRSPATPTAGNLLSVAVERLDYAVGEGPIGLIKIDVEGHEAEVLRGAERLLTAGLVRDIVFEDHDVYPDASTEMVERAGYRLFSLENDLFGLHLGLPGERRPVSPWPGPSYLATRDPERALARLHPRGWQVNGIGLTTPRPRRRRA